MLDQIHLTTACWKLTHCLAVKNVQKCLLNDRTGWSAILCRKFCKATILVLTNSWLKRSNRRRLCFSGSGWNYDDKKPQPDEWKSTRKHATSRKQLEGKKTKNSFCPLLYYVNKSSKEYLLSMKIFLKNYSIGNRKSMRLSQVSLSGLKTHSRNEEKQTETNHLQTNK